MSDPSPQSRADAIQELFGEASELPIHERGPFLDTRCAGDDSLRAEVESLLAADDSAAGFLAGPTIESSRIDPRFNTAASQEPARSIGPYKLLQTIGEGGFGTVYLAEQERPVRRRVALKVIKLGMDTRQVIARFEAERQALAMMDHPHIAKVFHAGATEDGRPYFVMELVDGIPITDYCDRHNLNLTSRMQLFVQVCQAVQHAHQKGLIHRDIKPTNILVTAHDGRPAPKVIDFGIAKATAARLTEHTLFTEFRQFVGTPQYMSPEQASANVDIDTRSDVYSLGVLMYELLTGVTPFDPKKLRGAAYAEMQRVIREEEPQKPSTRLSEMKDLIGSVAAVRHTEPARLGKSLRGDLDWIVMKCLEKDRAGRYETANGLAADVQRHLNDEPVAAGPPSARYLFAKFARRNRAALFSASLVVAALLIGSAVASWQAVAATRAKREAVAAARAETVAKELAEAREAETRAVLNFVEEKVFAAARPEGEEGGLGREVSLRSAMQAALPFVDQSFTSQPLTEAQLRRTLGSSFSYLGESQIAAEQQELAGALYTRHRGLDHPDTLRNATALARTYRALGRPGDALKLDEATLAMRKATLGPNHVDTLKSMVSLALTYGDLGRFDDARKLREETLPLMKATLGPEHPLTLRLMINLAVSHADFGRYSDAVALYEQTLPLLKATLGPDHPDALRSMSSLANSYDALARYDDALRLREQTLALQRSKLGRDHPDTLSSMNNLAISYGALGRQAEAFTLHEETLALRKAKLGPDHPLTLRSMNNLAKTHGELGRHVDALALHEQTLALRQAKLGADHPDTLVSMWGVAGALTELNRTAQASSIIEECLRLAAGKQVPPRLIPAMMELRLLHFQRIGDAAGCTETAARWEAMSRTDASSLYWSACFRAVCAAVISETDQTPAGEAKAQAQADQSMAWLTRAVAAGYRDVARVKGEKHLDALRDREDFKKLLDELHASTTSTSQP